VLRNTGILPLQRNARIYVEGVDTRVVADYATVVDAPEQADVAILRIAAPFEPRNDYFLEQMTHQGSLEFTPNVLAHVAAVARAVPVVLDVFLDRPAILTPLEGATSGLVVNFGASDAALLDALFGCIAPRGRLPFEIPRSMDAVRASRSDVAGDTEDALYSFGFGLRL